MPVIKNFTQVAQYFWRLTSNLISVDPNVTASEVLVGGVMTVVLSYDEFCCNLGGAQINIAAGSITLNTADVVNPTTYYLYVNPSGVVERSTTDPDVTYGEDTYAPIARARIASNAGTAEVFYLRRASTFCQYLLNEVGAYSADIPPLWIRGFAPIIAAASGVVDVEAGTYQRLIRTIDLPAYVGATIVLDDETTVANLEAVTTYSDGSAITGGKYHKLLLCLIASATADYRVLVVRQNVPTVEYATLEAARIDAERRAASGPPDAYFSSALPLAYVEMLKSDASDLDTQDLRQTGVTGGGGGGGGIADHGMLAGLGDDDHPQYTLADGTRAFTGALDIGGFAIANVGNVDGVDISAHAANAAAHHAVFTATEYAAARAYGNIYVTAGAAGQALTAATPALLTAFTTNGISLNTTPDHTNDRITVTNAGDYRVAGSFTFQLANNTNIRFFAAVGGVASVIGCATRSKDNGQPFNCGFNGLLTLGAGAVVTVLATASGNATLTVQEAHLTVERL